MIKNMQKEFIKKIENDLYRYNDHKGTMSIKEIAEYLKMSPDSVSRMLREKKYIDGRTHRYFVFDIADAIFESLTNSKEKEYSDAPLRKVA